MPLKKDLNYLNLIVTLEQYLVSFHIFNNVKAFVFPQLLEINTLISFSFPFISCFYVMYCIFCMLYLIVCWCKMYKSKKINNVLFCSVLLTPKPWAPILPLQKYLIWPGGLSNPSLTATGVDALYLHHHSGNRRGALPKSTIL